MEIIQSPTLLAETSNDILAAKQRELQAWYSQEVYHEVPDHGQQFMSVRWVITPSYQCSAFYESAPVCKRLPGKTGLSH